MTTPDQPIDPRDIPVLQMLAGAHFGPDAKVPLPSGREIAASEAQALTSAYAPAYGEDTAR